MENEYRKKSQKKREEEKKDIIKRTMAKKTLIDTSDEKFQNSPGLMRWAKIENLKTAAASYASAPSLLDLERQAASSRHRANTAKEELKTAERKLRKLKELLFYAEKYQATKPYHEKYKQSKDPDRYMRMNETQLILYDGARAQLKKMGLDPDRLDMRMIREDVSLMEKEKNSLQDHYVASRNTANDIERRLTNVRTFMEMDSRESKKRANDKNKRDL